MQAYALHRQFGGEGGGVWSLSGPLVDRLVWDKPGVAAAALVLPVRVQPALDVGLVGVGDPDCQPVQLGPAAFGEVEEVFLTIVKVAGRSYDYNYGCRGYLADAGNAVAMA